MLPVWSGSPEQEPYNPPGARRFWNKDSPLLLKMKSLLSPPTVVEFMSQDIPEPSKFRNLGETSEQTWYLHQPLLFPARKGLTSTRLEPCICFLESLSWQSHPPVSRIHMLGFVVGLSLPKDRTEDGEQVACPHRILHPMLTHGMGRK